MSSESPRPDLNEAISKVLRYGIFLSTVVIALGLSLTLIAPPPGTPTTLQAMLESSFGTPTLSPSILLAGVSRASSVAILELGTLLLLAIPLARVIASVLLFARERDSTYTCITLVVLAMLLTAILVVGPIEA